MNLWVYKVNTQMGNLAWGDWSSVFKAPWKAEPFGGAWATAKPDGKRIFDEEMLKGDLILAWQTNRRAALGLCEVVRWEPSVHGGDDVWLRATEEFAKPVRLHELKKTTHPELQDVASLQQGYSATIYPTSTKEARLLLAACGSSFTI